MSDISKMTPEEIMRELGLSDEEQALFVKGANELLGEGFSAPADESDDS